MTVEVSLKRLVVESNAVVMVSAKQRVWSKRDFMLETLVTTFERTN